MRKIRRYIIRNWFWIVLGLVLTRKAMEYCYRQRGSFQVGGEFFILPVILMAVYLIPNIVRDVLGVFREEGENVRPRNRREDGDMDAACAKALEQIEEKDYVDRLRQDGMRNFIKYGIACFKKDCKVVVGE